MRYGYARDDTLDITTFNGFLHPLRLNIHCENESYALSIHEGKNELFFW